MNTYSLISSFVFLLLRSLFPEKIPLLTSTAQHPQHREPLLFLGYFEKKSLLLLLSTHARDATSHNFSTRGNQFRGFSLLLLLGHDVLRPLEDLVLAHCHGQFEQELPVDGLNLVEADSQVFKGVSYALRPLFVDAVKWLKSGSG